MSRSRRRSRQQPQPRPAIPQRHEQISEHREFHRHEHSIELHDRRLFPSAQEVAQYDEILPGAADRIFTRWERQSEHRMQLERSIVRGGERRLNWGLAASAGVVYLSIAVGVGLVLLGHTEAGVIIASPAGVAAVARIFFNASRE